jgi:hypothetical protein
MEIVLFKAGFWKGWIRLQVTISNNILDLKEQDIFESH